VIVPVYNMEKKLGACLDSVLAQTMQDFELILIDDGSGDRSGEICDHYAGLHPFISVIHQENRGVSAARNRGLEAAAGRYVMFVDADDRIGKDHLQSYCMAAERDRTDAVIGGITILEEDGRSLVQRPERQEICEGPAFWKRLCGDFSLYGYMVNKLFLLDIIRRNACTFREDMYSQEDLNFCLRYYRHCRRFSLIGSSQYYYYHEAGRRKPAFADYISNQLLIRSSLSGAAGGDPGLVRKVDERILHLFYSGLYSAAKEHELDERLKEFGSIEMLDEALAGTLAVGEQKLVVKAYLKRRYALIRLWFRLREGIRKLAGREKRPRKK
jgi:glycosyltransferase EpsJ